MNPAVCLFTDSVEPSGMGEHMLILAAELRGQFDITVVCPRTRSCTPLVERARALGLKVRVFSASYDKPRECNALRLWLQREQFDIFHCHAGIAWEGFGGVIAARQAGVPALVRTEHLPYLLTNPQQRRDHLRFAGMVDGLICVSSEARESYIASGLPADRVHAVLNGIPVRRAQVDPWEVRERLGLPASSKLILTVGRMTPQKGYDYLLTAVPTILGDVPNAYFVWVGSGRVEPRLRRNAAKQDLGQHLLFLQGRTDVAEIVAASDLFVLPSLFEGLPLVVLEAMAAGIPVVGTRVCGTSEAVQDGVTGLLVEPKNPASLASAVIALLCDPERSRRYGAAGRRRVERNFTAARMARETADIYTRLLAGSVQAASIQEAMIPVRETAPSSSQRSTWLGGSYFPQSTITNIQGATDG